ncbi:MAG TPA: cupredoxin domain-containing protein [Solirubrobacter sp.]|nr:cupredoxin domain-containing protein [Solirubrobacter sp.]
MSWLAILLTLASLGGGPGPVDVKPKKQCAGKVTKQCKKKTAKKCTGKKAKAKAKCKKKAKPKTPPRQETAPATPRTEEPSPAPQQGAAPTPTPTPAATATPAPTPAPPGTYPSRTNVDLDEWFVRSSYRALAAGPIEFNVNNRGEDDHNLAVRGGGKEYGKIDVPPGESASMTLNLWLGSYTLYCSLPDHEEAGMRVDISVR